jgi:hypothetical protein
MRRTTSLPSGGKACGASATSGPRLTLAHPTLLEKKMTVLVHESRSGLAIQVKSRLCLAGDNFGEGSLFLQQYAANAFWTAGTSSRVPVDVLLLANRSIGIMSIVSLKLRFWRRRKDRHMALLDSSASRPAPQAYLCADH